MISYHLHFLIWVITLYLSQISKFPPNLFVVVVLIRQKYQHSPWHPVLLSSIFFFFFKKVPHIAVFTSSLLYKFTID